MTEKLGKIMCLIPARGGSKGIPQKNIYPLNGIPLIEYTIQEALKVVDINSVMVSSDDRKILNCASREGVILVPRPLEISKDDSTVEDAITHAIARAREFHNEFQTIIILQPTSPLRNAEDILEAIHLYEASGADSLISVCEVHPFLYKYKYPLSEICQDPGDEFVVEPDFLFHPRLCRQRLERIDRRFRDCCAIYICSVKYFEERHSFIAELGKMAMYEMPPERAVDIDTMEDMKLAEYYLTR